MREVEKRFQKLTQAGFLAALILIVTLVSLGCVQTSTPVEEPATSVEGPTEVEEVELAIGNHLTNEAWHASLQALLDEYHEKNPHITIEQQSTAFGELNARVAADRLADNPPDLYILPAWWVGNLVENGVASPVPDDIAADIKANITPGAVEAVTWEGKIWGIPMENNPTIMVYNKAALEEAGYDRPPETLDELKEYALKLTKTDAEGNVSQYGYSQWVGSLNWNYLPFVSLLYSNGGDLFNAETGEALFNGPEGVEILQMQVDLIKSGAFNPELQATDWYTNRVAITMLPNWTRYYLANFNDPDNFATAPVPHGAGHQSGAIVYTWFVFVNDRSEHKQEAWDFIRWFAQPYAENTPTRSAQFYYDIASIIPARRTDLAAMAELFSTDVFPAYVESVDYAKSPPPVPEYEEIINILIAEIESAWFEQKTPQQALDDAAAQVEALLQAP